MGKFLKRYGAAAIIAFTISVFGVVGSFAVLKNDVQRHERKIDCLEKSMDAINDVKEDVAFIKGYLLQKDGVELQKDGLTFRVKLKKQ